ncbi:MAG: hypothetical protein K6U89_20325 [Chloroflexi bacterium]|nr:hypothetical protein [Chloroflexota bacterium]
MTTTRDLAAAAGAAVVSGTVPAGAAPITVSIADAVGWLAPAKSPSSGATVAGSPPVVKP